MYVPSPLSPSHHVGHSLPVPGGQCLQRCNVARVVEHVLRAGHGLLCPLVERPGQVNHEGQVEPVPSATSRSADGLQAALQGEAQLAQLLSER